MRQHAVLFLIGIIEWAGSMRGASAASDKCGKCRDDKWTGRLGLRLVLVHQKLEGLPIVFGGASSALAARVLRVLEDTLEGVAEQFVRLKQ